MTHDHGHGHGHHHHHGDGWGAHGNPEDLQAFITKMTDPERFTWQKPDAVLSALDLQPGMTVAEIGVGPGYWVMRASRLLGPGGTVFAVDVEPRMFEVLHAVIERESLTNVVPVFGRPTDPLLPRAACDLVLIINTYHHFADGPDYLRRTARALKPGGRIVNIDFHKRDMEIGPPSHHKIDKAEFLEQAASVGLVPVKDHGGLLEHQYFVELRAEQSGAGR